MLKQIKNRPLMFFIVFFFIGMAASSAFLPVSRLVCLVFGVICAVLLAVTRRGAAISLVLGLSLGIAFQYFPSKEKNEILSYSGSECEMLAVVESVSYSSDYFCAYTVRAVRLDGDEVGFKCSLEIPYDIGATENDVIRLRARLSIPEKDSFGFELREYYASQGIYLSAEAIDSDAVIAGFDRSLPSYFRSLSSKLSVKLKTHLGKENGGFVSGLLLGRKSDVPDSVTTSFRYLGISHILSVSGLHLAIITGLLAMVLQLLTAPRALRHILSLCFIIFFILLTGARPSVMRSGIMLILIIVGEIIDEDAEPLTSLSLAALIIVLISPSTLYDAGFILSVSATAGIIILGAPLTTWLYHLGEGRKMIIRLLLRVLSLAAVTAAATLFTLPAIWYFFGETSSVSVITNIIFIPLTTALLYFSLFLLLFSGTVFLSAFAGITASLSRLVIVLSDGLSRVLPPPIDLTYPFTVLCVLLTVGIGVYFIAKKKRGIALMLSFAVFAASYGGCLIYYTRLHRNTESIICASVNGNDFIMVNSGKSTLLCDFSNGSYSSIRRLSELSQPVLHDPSVDVLLLTHLHRKHIDSVGRLCDSDRIRELFLPLPQNDEEQLFFDAISKAASERGVTVKSYHSDRDVTFDFEGVKITLYKSEYIERSVQPIHMLKIEGKSTLLYAGGAAFESDMLTKLRKELEGTDTLFLGCHGPLIKKAIPPTVYGGQVFVSDDETNAAYGTAFETVGFYKLFKYR